MPGREQRGHRDVAELDRVAVSENAIGSDRRVLEVGNSSVVKVGLSAGHQ